MIRAIARVIRWCGPRKKRLYRGFFYSFIHSIFVGLPIMALAQILNMVLLDARGTKPLDGRWIWYSVGLMVFSVAGRFAFSYLRAVNQDSIAYERTAEVRLGIGDIIKRVPLGFFEKNNVGRLTAAITADLSYLEMHAMKMIDTVVNGYIMAAVFIACLAFFSLPVAGIALMGVALSACALHGLGKKSRKNSPVHAASQEKMIGATLEYVRAIPLVKSFKMQGAAVSGIERAFAESRRINIKIEREFVATNCMHLIALRFAAAGIVLYAAMAAVRGDMPLSTMLMIVVFSFVLFAQVEAVNNATHVLNMVDVTMNQVEAIEKARFIDAKGAERAVSDSEIRFDRVQFGYDDRKVIRDVSFAVPAGTTTAIVGPSGSGKTTLARLMMRFYDVNAGKITLGGADLSAMTLNSLLKNYSMVFQRVYLFHDTLFNNIRFGKPDATPEEVREAARKAQCHDFIAALPQGYDTVIGEGGATLSGGEKQRVSIARAILKDAPVIILDEATASVDPENEHLIQRAISALARGKTMVIIAHRLATIRSADQILVMENGKIAQCGTHEALMRQDGLYRRFAAIRERAEGWSITPGTAE